MFPVSAQVFKQNYSTLLRLKEHFPFHLIDAMGTVEECEGQIANELRYQSSLELSEKTYQARPNPETLRSALT